MKNIKTQLIAMTIAFSFAIFDGVFNIGFSEDFYGFVGLVMLGILIWMWIDYANKK